jgi:hypothetical protein
MTAIIVRDSEGFFDDPKESETFKLQLESPASSLYFCSSQPTFLNWARRSTWLEQSVQEWIGFSQRLRQAAF